MIDKAWNAYGPGGIPGHLKSGDESHFALSNALTISIGPPDHTA